MAYEVGFMAFWLPNPSPAFFRVSPTSEPSSQFRQARPCLRRSRDLRHHKRGPIGPGRKLLRRIRKLAHEPLLLRIIRYPRAEHRGRGGKVDAVLREIFATAIEGIGELLVRTDLFPNRFRRR